MSSLSAGRLSAIVCIAVGLSIGLMKTLFPTVYDLIGSSCLVLVGMSLLAVCLIFCAIPYIQCCHSPSEKIEIVATPVFDKKHRSGDFPPTYEESELDFSGDFKSESDTSSIGKASIIDGESVKIDIPQPEESPVQVKAPPPSISPETSVAVDIDMTELRKF